MATCRTATPAQAELLAELLEARLLLDSGVPGIYGRSAAFEDVRLAVDELVTRTAAGDRAEQLRFPPVLPRRHLETSGYLKSFPHLAGTIFSFEGDETAAFEQHERAAHHEDWSGYQRMTDLVLVPAACYPVYPAVAARGPLGADGLTVDAGGSYVFRHEPSRDPARLQMFHQREMVRIGMPDEVASWRDSWRDRCVALLQRLGLEPAVDIASDPFFGRGGRMLAKSQLEQALKLEVTIPIAGDQPSAVASFNYHREHFADAFGIVGEDGPVHTACLGFGLERIALGLFSTHGLDAHDWPADVRRELWP